MPPAPHRAPRPAPPRRAPRTPRDVTAGGAPSTHPGARGRLRRVRPTCRDFRPRRQKGGHSPRPIRRGLAGETLQWECRGGWIGAVIGCGVP